MEAYNIILSCSAAPSYSISVGEERAELLRRWVQSKENVQACECLIKATRRSTLQGQRVVQLVAVKDTGKAPHHFSEFLGNNIVALLHCAFGYRLALPAHQPAKTQNRVYYCKPARHRSCQAHIWQCVINSYSRSLKLLPIHIEDRDAPGIVEETKYWVTTAETRTDTLDISLPSWHI